MSAPQSIQKTLKEGGRVVKDKPKLWKTDLNVIEVRIRLGQSCGEGMRGNGCFCEYITLNEHKAISGGEANEQKTLKKYNRYYLIS